MTKLHESFYKGNIDEVIKKISNSLKVLKGEFVVVVEGKNRVEKEIILEKLAYNGEFLRSTAEKFQNDKEVVMTAVTQNGWSLQ